MQAEAEESPCIHHVHGLLVVVAEASEEVWGVRRGRDRILIKREIEQKGMKIIPWLTSICCKQFLVIILTT